MHSSIKWPFDQMALISSGSRGRTRPARPSASRWAGRACRTRGWWSTRSSGRPRRTSSSSRTSRCGRAPLVPRVVHHRRRVDQRDATERGYSTRAEGSGLTPHPAPCFTLFAGCPIRFTPAPSLLVLLFAGCVHACAFPSCSPLCRMCLSLRLAGLGEEVQRNPRDATQVDQTGSDHLFGWIISRVVHHRRRVDQRDAIENGYSTRAEGSGLIDAGAGCAELDRLHRAHRRQAGVGPASWTI